MAMNGEKAALAMVGVGEIFQIMASMLPSPTTMMQGGGDPERIAQLRRNRLQGAVISTTLLGGVAYFVGKDDRSQGWILFLAGMAALYLFWHESERALQMAEQGAGEDGGY
jgi:hypothetical protein